MVQPCDGDARHPELDDDELRAFIERINRVRKELGLELGGVYQTVCSAPPSCESSR